MKLKGLDLANESGLENLQPAQETNFTNLTKPSLGFGLGHGNFNLMYNDSLQVREEKRCKKCFLHKMNYVPSESPGVIMEEYLLSDARIAWISSRQVFPGINDVNLISHFLAAEMQNPAKM